MIEKDYLLKMNHVDIFNELENQQKVLDGYVENSEMFMIVQTTLPEAVANVYEENAQLYRRMADIYIDWACQLRANGEVTEW